LSKPERQERESLVVGGLVVLLVGFPLGFLVHVDARFPGSLAGSLLGIAGAVLMLAPFAYLVIKRAPPLKARVTRYISMRTLLTIHIYAGILGPLLGLVHAAHKFESPLGVSLTGLMLVVVVSGYVGRYLLAQLGRAIRGRQSDLAALRAALDRAGPVPTSAAKGGLLGAIPDGLIWRRSGTEAPSPARLAGAIADIEFAVRAEALLKALFDRWLKLHIVIALALYALLALHIWSGLYYGLRWL
jgi:hypothetical protein